MSGQQFYCSFNKYRIFGKVMTNDSIINAPLSGPVSSRGSAPARALASRNILLSAVDFTAVELDIIMVLVYELRENQYLKDTENKYMDGIDISLRFDDLSDHHGKREDLVNTLDALRAKRITYQIDTGKRRKATIFTGLFDYVASDRGCVLAHVSKMAVPWMMNIGVGYSPVDLSVFKSLRSVYTKRLFCLVFSHLRKGQVLSFDISLDDLRERIGVDEAVEMKRINQRIIKPLKDSINDGGEYTFDYSVRQEKSSGGHPKVSGVHFSMSRSDSKAISPERLIGALQACYSAWRIQGLDLVPFDSVLDQLTGSGEQEFFLESYSECLASRKGKAHQARAMLRLLEDTIGVRVVDGKLPLA